MGFYLADYLIKAYPDRLRERYNLEDIPATELEFLEMAAKRRGALSGGGRVNLHKICELLINEMRAGMLGNITLETPAMIETEEQEVAARAAQKAEEKANRKTRFKNSDRNRKDT